MRKCGWAPAKAVSMDLPLACNWASPASQIWFLSSLSAQVQAEFNPVRVRVMPLMAMEAPKVLLSSSLMWGYWSVTNFR